MWSDQEGGGKSLDFGGTKVDISTKVVQHMSCFGRYSGDVFMPSLVRRYCDSEICEGFNG